MDIKVGDFVKGITSKYGIMNEQMTKGVVTKIISSETMEVKVLEHVRDAKGCFIVEIKDFEVIGHQKPFNREEVIELLKSGCKKAILDYDLTEANLTEVDLTGADLTRANLTGANLTGADLRGADLTEANLTEANLRGADLRGAYLRGADLTRADLRGADLTEANLTEANLRGADLIRADLTRADLRGADLTEAYLTRANLTEADLTEADLRGADLTRADLRGADLTEANLTEADLDFSCLPLWCGSLKMKVDKRLACQIAYHLCSMQCDDEEYKAMRNSILGFANQFHRVGECGKLD